MRAIAVLDPLLQAQQHSVFALVLQQRLDIHKIEGRQLVEVDDVRGHVVGRQNQVLQKPAIVGRLDAVGHLLGLDRGYAVWRGTHAADALSDLLGVQRIPAR